MQDKKIPFFLTAGKALSFLLIEKKQNRALASS